MKMQGQLLGVRRKKVKVWGQCEHMGSVADIRLLLEGLGLYFGPGRDKAP